MKTCTHNEPAITVFGQGNSSNAFLHPYTVKANCKCPALHFWKLKKYSYEEDRVYQVYKCAKVIYFTIIQLENWVMKKTNKIFNNIPLRACDT